MVFHPALHYHSNRYFAGGSMPFHYLLPLLNSAPACNIVLLQVGHDVVSFGCSTLSATVPADGMLTGFLLLSSTFKTIQALVPGGRFSKTPPDSNTFSLGVILIRPTDNDFGKIFELHSDIITFHLLG